MDLTNFEILNKIIGVIYSVDWICPTLLCKGFTGYPSISTNRFVEVAGLKIRASLRNGFSTGSIFTSHLFHKYKSGLK